MMNVEMQEDGMRSMALRERGDELGEDSIRYRDAVIQVLQKVQQFMRVGEIAAYAVRSGLLTDPVPLVEEYVSRIVAFDIAMGRDGLLKRSPEGGYGLKEWLDDAEESQSTIPDNEAEQSDSVGQKHLPGRSLDPRPMYSMLEGQSWQSTSNNSRYSRMITPWLANDHGQEWMHSKMYNPGQNMGLKYWGKAPMCFGSRPSRTIWNGMSRGLHLGPRRITNILNIPLPNLEAFHGVLGDEAPVEEQLSSFDEQDDQYEQDCLSGIAKGTGDEAYGGCAGMLVEPHHWCSPEWPGMRVQMPWQPTTHINLRTSKIPNYLP